MQNLDSKDNSSISENINRFSREALEELEKLSIEQKNILNKYRENIEKSRIDELRKELYES